MSTLTLSTQALPTRAVRLTASDRMLLRAAVALTDMVQARRARRLAMREVYAYRGATSEAQRLSTARLLLGMQ